MSDTQNVTLAVLSTKIDAIHIDLQAYCQKHYKLEKRVRVVEDRSSRNQERLGLLTMFQTGLTLITSIVADGWGQ